MQIPAISAKNSLSSFRGILTDEVVTRNDYVHYDNGLEEEVGSRYTLRERRYYPYKGESEAQIFDAVNKYRGTANNSTGLVGIIDEARVYVQKHLPYTEQEVKKFLKEFDVTEKEFVKFFEMFKFFIKR